ncbi:hypothetical protein DY000_02013772 [Brassica cretica]|uniref:Uncharacterized protein n=1 Tax=Brassica cretica TaxID=69181 RepID=A0ABQ7CSA8_BRACR|nr:hypothetical protein DY000_02013772 [Brassica cretica]
MTSKEVFYDREINDLVNHIGGAFQYFIVDVVDPGSTPDVADLGSSPDVAGFSRVLQGCKNLLMCEKDFGLLTRYDGGRLLEHEREVSELSSICSHKECVTVTRVLHWFCMGLSEDAVRDFTWAAIKDMGRKKLKPITSNRARKRRLRGPGDRRAVTKIAEQLRRSRGRLTIKEEEQT